MHSTRQFSVYKKKLFMQRVIGNIPTQKADQVSLIGFNFTLCVDYFSYTAPLEAEVTSLA